MQHETNGNTGKPLGKDWKLHESASLDLRLQWKCNGIYNVESCGTNMSLSKNMYRSTAERTVSNLRDNLPYALPAAAPRSGFALFQSQIGWARNRVQRKRQRKTCDKWETQAATASLESLFDVFPVFVPLRTIFAAQCWAATCTMGATWIIPESPKKWHCFWFLATNGSTKWITEKPLGEFLRQFWNDLPFSLQFLELQTATSRKEGPTENENRPFGSLKYWTNESVSFLPLLAKVLKRNAQHDARCVLIPNIQLLGRSSEGFTLVRSSELVGPARGISRVWFPNKDSQSIPSKVLPNLGIPKHIAWKKMTWNARSASTATGATLFSQRRATVAGCGDQTANGVLSNSRVWVFACLWRTTL